MHQIRTIDLPHPFDRYLLNDVQVRDDERGPRGGEGGQEELDDGGVEMETLQGEEGEDAAGEEVVEAEEGEVACWKEAGEWGVGD